MTNGDDYAEYQADNYEKILQEYIIALRDGTEEVPGHYLDKWTENHFDYEPEYDPCDDTTMEE